MTAVMIESPSLTNMASSRSIYNLEQAKFILSEILMNQHSIKKMAKDFLQKLAGLEATQTGLIQLLLNTKI